MFERIIDVLFPPQCASCSRVGSGLCALCEPANDDSVARRLPTLDVCALAPYRGAMRLAVLALKDGRRDVAQTLAKLLARTIEPGTLLVPVPTTPGRARVRGMDNVVLLARLLADQSAGRLVAALRHAGNDAQRGRSREARLAAHGRFICDGSLVVARTVVLCDDVCTTGSTLEDCARAVRASGGRVEQAVVVALA